MPAPRSSWDILGFRSTPYSTQQIPTTDNGERLLVGRENELDEIHQKFVDGVKMVALEGDYGVGKSSLAAVASHQASRWHEDDPKHLFLPAIGHEPLEIREGDSLETFEKKVYSRIARSFLERADDLLRDGYTLNKIKDFSAWLREPNAASWTAGIGINIPTLAGIEISVGRGNAPNTSAGFSDTGVIDLVNTWIAEVFQGREASGVVCILDNLETIKGLEQATTLFQSLRDSLFRRAGLVWIVCGAEGMVRTAFSTKKMAGVFHEPIDVLPLASTEIPKVIEARASQLRGHDHAVLPVSPAAFGEMYKATGQNLRFALGLADSYSTISGKAKELLDISEKDREERFSEYLVVLGDRVVSDISQKVTAADWKVLRKLVKEKSGFSSPSEFADYGYADMPPLIARVNKLKAAGLVEYVVVKEDGRKRMINATENGRLAMLGAAANQSEA